MHRYITNIAALLLAVVLPAAFAADNAQDAENRIKAAFLYHFCNYVQWPESAFAAPGDELVIGVAGPEAIVQAVDAAVSQRAANGHPMRVRRVSSGDQLDGVHLLYVDADATLDVDRLATAIAGRAVLVVTDRPGGLDAGSVINFVIENDKVRFDVALDEARARELRVSAQLLTVARNVREAD